jgi:hypothetical protein
VTAGSQLAAERIKRSIAVGSHFLYVIGSLNTRLSTTMKRVKANTHAQNETFGEPDFFSQGLSTCRTLHHLLTHSSHHGHRCRLAKTRCCFNIPWATTV